MKTKFADLWRTEGTVDRRTYALVGVVAFALKHNLDRLVASYVFHRPWGVFNYWTPLRDVARIKTLSRADVVFLETIIALALPFIWLGVALTLKRLRSANLPAQLVLLFFVPFLNLLFFLFLSITPAQNPSEPEQSKRQKGGLLISRLLPQSAIGSAALLLPVPFAVAIGLAGVYLLNTYGWALFVALPFAVGFAAALIYALHGLRSLSECILVACGSIALLGLALLMLAVEGVGCLIMALPIALPLAMLGGVFGYLVQKHRWLRQETPAFLAVLLLFVPGIQWVQHAVSPVPTVYMVRSSVDVQAPPERVWKQVVAFTEIPPPREWIFRAGVAYPIRAEIMGNGPGAERHCVFSTGAFVEPIEIWDEPHMLKFSVTSNPAPMEEWTPYHHINPPHMHGFLVSNGGQFVLTALLNGGTHLEGTTWYRHTLWPASYWRLWSDTIIHQIHMRVLRHIRDKTENRTG